MEVISVLSFNFNQISPDLFYLLTLDVNECKKNSHKCDKNAECNNTRGSYTCICKPGYSGDGYNCQGIVHLLPHRKKQIILRSETCSII